MSLMQNLMSDRPVMRDAHGDLVELEDWSEEIALERAKTLGIALTPEHLRVLKFLRLHYMDGGNAGSAQMLLRDMEERFQDDGGGRFLYQLFPGGPVTQGLFLAGLPSKAYSSDASFGSVT
ncbi:MAG: TusE/DsrC/DsvC family sulfur relay protein [Thiobacillaceae bacterium]